MKRLYRLSIATLMSICYLGSISISAQIIIDKTVPDPAAIEAQIEYILAPLDMSPVSSGILMDRTVTPAYYPELVQSTAADSVYMEYLKFDQIYSSLYAGRIAGHTLIDPETAYRVHYNSYPSGTPIPIYLSAADYHRFDPLAISDGRLDSIGGRLFNPAGISTSAPYEQYRIYASSLLSYQSAETELSFIIQPEYLLGNVEIDAASILLDADDGLGYRSLILGTPLELSYPADVVRTLKLSFADLDGNITTHYHKIMIGNAPSGELVIETRGAPITFECIEGDTCFTWPISNPGAPYSPLEVSIKLACGEDLSSLKKPLIILEGIELIWDVNYSNEEDFFTKKIVFDHPNIYGNKTLDSILQENDYDIIFVDYHDPHVRIQENARSVRELIKELNRIKAANGSSEPNVMMGFSMGGVVGKYALLDMEAHEEDHEMDTYITFDAPMQGANIPYAFQSFVDHFLDFSIPFNGKIREQPASKKLVDFEKVLKSPSSRQLLVHNVYEITDNGTMHKDFYNELEAMGDLQHCQTMAIANGSSKDTSGLQPLLPGEAILTINQEILDEVQNNTYLRLWNYSFGVYSLGALYADVDVDIVGLALPGKRIGPDFLTYEFYDGEMALDILYGFVDISNSTYRATSQQRYAPIDSAPGGAFETNVISSVNNEIKIRPSFVCFIPTVSALDIQPRCNLQYGDDILQAINPSTPSSYNRWTAQDQSVVIAGIPQALNNQKHVELTYENVSLILDQITNSQGLKGYEEIQDRTFNFGKGIPNPSDTIFVPSSTPHIISKDLDILSNGKVWINRNNRIDFIDLSENLSCLHDTYFDVRIQKDVCNNTPTDVSFFDHSELHIGDFSVNNIGDLIVGPETKLHFYEGSMTTLDNGSRIIIEDGGELYLYAGSNVELLGNASIIIEDGGKLVYHDGANLNLDQAGIFAESHLQIPGSHLKIHGELLLADGVFYNSGNGYIHFDEGHPTVTSNTSDILITGQGKTGPINMYINAKTIIRKNSLLKDCNIINNDVLDFRHYNSARIESCNSFGGEYRYRNINYTDIEDCEFNNASHQIHETGFFSAADSKFFGNAFGQDKPAIHALHSTSITMKNVEFYDNYISIQSGLTDYGIVLVDVEFKDHNHANWSLSQMSNPLLPNEIAFKGAAIVLDDQTSVRMYNTLIDDAPIGIYSLPGANITMKNGSSISHCAAGIFMVGTQDLGMVDMDCSSLIDNEVGIIGRDILLNIDAYEHAIATDCVLRPNTFIDDYGHHDHMFNIQYVNRFVGIDTLIIHAKGNFWRSASKQSNVVHNQLTNWNSSVPVIFDNANMATVQPTSCPAYQNNCNPSIDPILHGGTVVNIPFDDSPSSIYNYTPPNWINTVQHTYGPAYLHYVKYLAGALNNGKGATIDWDLYYYGLEPFREIADINCEDYYLTLPSYIRNRVDVARSLIGTECYYLDNRGALQKQMGFSLSPNPAIDLIKISRDKVFDHLEILNARGQVIVSKSLKVDGLIRYNITNLKTGIYFIRLSNTLSGNSGVRKWIKI